jgi:hypothetical protein
MVAAAMNSKTDIHAIACLGALAVMFAVSPVQAQQAACQYYQVAAAALNIFSQPNGDASFVGTANKNDFVCVIGEQNVPGDRVWAHIAYKLTGQNHCRSPAGTAAGRSAKGAGGVKTDHLAGMSDPLQRDLDHRSDLLQERQRRIG